MSQTVEILAGECSLYSNYLVWERRSHTSFWHYTPGHDCIPKVVLSPLD